MTSCIRIMVVLIYVFWFFAAWDVYDLARGNGDYERQLFMFFFNFSMMLYCRYMAQSWVTEDRRLKARRDGTR